jgi:Bacterial archaeo-eukaryotic release factor family 10
MMEITFLHPTLATNALTRHDEFLVALADRQRLRLLRHAAGSLDEIQVIDEPLPRRLDTDMHRESAVRYHDDKIRTHYIHAATAIDAACLANPAAGLLLGGTVEAVSAVAKHLHEPAAGRLVGELWIPATSTMAEISAAMRAALEEVADRHAAAVLAELRERTAAGERAVLGLDRVLESLIDRRPSTLVVEQGLAVSGWQCENCGRLDTRDGSCDRCASAYRPVDDVVAAAIAVAQQHHATIDVIRAREPWEGIGAFERF